MFNVKYMSHIFEGCSSLMTIPDISKWNTYNIITMNNMFRDCKLLSLLLDISKWNNENVVNNGEYVLKL